MSDEINDLKNKIDDLEKQLAEAKENNNIDEEFKQKYEEIIAKKDKEITELNKTLKETKKKVNTTVNNLNDEITEKLEANEKYQELLATVKELERDKAEATVDTFIQQGKLLPAQRETALKLCLNDNDTFLELYKDAKPIIDTTSKPQSKKVNADVNRLVDYFKK